MSFVRCRTRRFLLRLLPPAALAGLQQAAAQQAPPVPSGTPAGPPLRQDPADWWGDVHRWTGSEETRPRGTGRAAPAGPAPDGPLPGGARTVVTRTAPLANIRREPSVRAPIVARVPPGTQLTVLEEGTDGWLRVGTQRMTGWIHSSVLAP